jgi:CBS domain containing-hemolysin-like protein
LTWLVKLLAPALVISRALTGLLTPDEAIPLSRGEIAAVIDGAGRDGALSPEETALLANLLQTKDVRIEDVMTPRTVTFMMPLTTSVADLLKDPEAEAFSRIPLFDDGPDHIVGYVLVRDVMRAAAAGCDRGRKLTTWMRQIWHVPEMLSVGDALPQFLERRESIAIVTDEHGGMAGLVTLEDLMETLLGTEIVDESDRHVDLRQKAAEWRDRRLARLRQKRELVSGEPAAERTEPE